MAKQATPNLTLREGIDVFRRRWPDVQSRSSEAPVILMAAGHRTGSTLLHRMLSQDCLMWGEPYGHGGLLDIHLAWYDPINTIANVPSTPPSSTTANAPRDNLATLSPLSPLFNGTLTFEAQTDERTAYYEVNAPRCGDNFTVAAHPHLGFELRSTAHGRGSEIPTPYLI